MLKEDYKQKRDELDDILMEMNIPKHLWHVPIQLNLYIFTNNRFHPDAQKAMDLLHEMSPTKLTHFNLTNTCPHLMQNMSDGICENCGEDFNSC